MGRTLDSLRHAEPQRPAHAAMPTPRSDAPPGECVVDWTLQEEVPFIEVGGPGKAVELSPSLVKHPPQPKIQPHHPMLGKALAAETVADEPLTKLAPLPVVDLTESRPMTVAFEAWPGTSASAGVAAEIVSFHQPEHPVSKAYAALFDSMLHGVGTAAPCVLMLCGLKRHVGTSTVLLNLAVAAARRSKRVAAVDANLQYPMLATRMGHANPAGLCDVIAGTLAPSQALLLTPLDPLKLLAGGHQGKAKGPLSGEAMSWLFAWLRERFDVILIDGPCVDAADIAVLAPCAHGTFLVLPQGEPNQATRGIAQTIARMGGSLRGLIHTHFEQ